MTASDAVEPLRHQLERRHLIRNPGIANLGLGAHQPLRHGFFRHQKRLGDFGGRQPADRAQRQRDLRFLRQRRMAAGENQTQDVVVATRRLRACVFGKPLADSMIGHQFSFDLLALGEKAHVTPQTIDRLVAPDIDQPGAGIGRDAFARPLHRAPRRRHPASHLRRARNRRAAGSAWPARGRSRCETTGRSGPPSLSLNGPTGSIRPQAQRWRRHAGASCTP